MTTLMILNDPPYETERTYNGLRFALNLLSKVEGTQVTVFLMGDAVGSAKEGQQTPNGYYSRAFWAARDKVSSAGRAWMPAASRRPRSSRGVAAARSTSSRREPPRPRRSWCSDESP